MSDLNILNSLINDVIATQDVAMDEISTGGAGGGLMPEGYAMARLCKYIELGKQPQEYNGKAKAPADEVQIGFKLYGGEYEGRFIGTFDLALSNNEKAGAKVLFDRLNWKGDLKHFAQALGRGFLVPIKVVENRQKKQVNRLDTKGILPPIDPVSKAMYPIPELDTKDLRYFFFNKPTKETWDALFVEGNWDDGGSKNKVQEKILSALNYPGSALEQLLSGVVLPDTAEAVATPAPQENVAPAPAAEPVQAAAAPALTMPAMPMP